MRKKLKVSRVNPSVMVTYPCQIDTDVIGGKAVGFVFVGERKNRKCVG